MKKVVKILLIMLLGFVAINTNAQTQVPDDIIVSLRTGNASGLAKYFSPNVELVVLDNENVYSKAHAEQILTDFFKKNPPQKFTIIHQGGKDDYYFVIGNLQVNSNKFRVYFLIKNKNNMPNIHQLRIEKEN